MERVAEDALKNIDFWLSQNPNSKVRKYEIQHNDSFLDDFIIKLSEILKDKYWGIKVYGTFGKFKKSNLITNCNIDYPKKFIKGDKDANNNFRIYSICFILKPVFFNFKPCHMDWLSVPMEKILGSKT